MSIRKARPASVSDVMLPLGRFPAVAPTTIFKQALEEMGKARLGIICIVDEEGKLAGILTDGDIRRKLLNVQKPFSAFFVDDVIDHAIRSPLVVSDKDDIKSAVKKMEKKQVWDLPVLDSGGVLVGLLHLHPVVQALLDTE